MEITIPSTVQVESASTGEPNTGALYGPGGSENIILRMESQELRIRNSISEETAHSEFKAMERNARYVLFYQDQQFKMQSHKHPRQVRDTVNQAVRESSEKFEIMMLQEFQGCQNRYEGRMEENERRVAQVIGSEAREALRSQRSHGLLEHEVLFQAGEREK